MDGRYQSLLLLVGWIVAMMATLAWSFRRRQARIAAGERVGCLLSLETIVFLVIAVVLTVVLAEGTIFLTRRV